MKAAAAEPKGEGPNLYPFGSQGAADAHTWPIKQAVEQVFR